MLREWQCRFADTIIAGGDASAALIRDGKLSAARRIEVYRHNVFSNLRGALKDVYPVTLRIVGEAFFSCAADRYVRETPSTSGDLNQFGRKWPDFLAAYPPVCELPYLPDVARLEWAWHECFHAADALPLDLSCLAAFEPERHGALVFRLHPAVRLLTSAYPLVRIWQVNQVDFIGDMAIDWSQDGDALLVRRDGFDEAEGVAVTIQALPAGAWQFLRGLQQGFVLASAVSAAIETDDSFDLPPFLSWCVQSRVIAEVVTEASVGKRPSASC